MKKFNYIAFVLIFITALIVRINAATTSYNDIPNNSYVIGTHLYTNEVGLTIKHIMLASNTIEGNTLSDMKLYYKTSRGKWIDGLTGEEKSHLSSYTINYENSETTSTYYENANTKEIDKNDIPNNSYVIGTYLYTSEMPLTTNHIMLASRTIRENTLNKMKIYYKTSRGKWIDGVSGEEVTVSNSIKISHTNLVGVSKENGYVTLNESSKTITYGDNQITFSVTNSHGGSLSVNDNNSTVTESINGNTITVKNLSTMNVGTKIIITVISAETDNYSEASATYTININPKILTIPSSPSDKTYTGSSQVSGITCPTGSTASGTQSATDASSTAYTQTCTLSSTTNYKWNDNTTTAKNITWKINPKSVSVTWGSTTEFTYNGSAQAPTASVTTGVTGETMTVTRTTQTNASDTAYTSTASCSSVSGGQAKCSNYTLTENTKSFTIGRQGIAFPSCTSVAYNGGSQTLFAAHTSGQYTNSAISGKDAGSYTGSLTPTSNYKWNSGSNVTSARTLTCTIMPKSLAVSWGTLTWTYDGSAHSTTASVTTGVSGETMSVSISNNSITYKGTQAVAASCGSVSGGQAKCANYTLTNTGKTLTVNAKAITITAKAQEVTYGTAISKTTSDVTVATLGSGDSLTAITLTESTSNATTSGTITPSAATIKKGTTDVTSSYSITYNTGVLTINAKVLGVPSSPADKTYTGSSQGSGITCPAGSTASGTQSATNANEGSATYTQTCTLSSTTNYKWSDNTTTAKNITWKIKPKSVSVSWGSTTEFTYNGSAQAPTASVSTGVTGETMTVTRTTQTNASDTAYTSTASCSSVSGGQAKCANYTLTENTKSFTITQRPVVVTAPIVVDDSLTYTGSAQNLLATAGSCSTGGTMYWYSSNPTTSSTSPSFSTSTWTTTAPTSTSYKGTDIGTYYIWYYCRVTDTTNNKGTGINKVKNVSKEIAENITLSIQYNGNGGTWNENNIPDGKKIYIDNQADGMVRLRSNGEIYNAKYDPGRQDINLLDYNGGYLNWSRSDAGVPPESEYYIINNNTSNKTYLNQKEEYTAIYLANASGCDLTNTSCTVIVYVNWESYQITDEDYLKVSGTKFVKTGDNKGIVLRGFNIGEWLSRAISLSPMENASITFDTSNFPSPFTNLSPAYWREYADNDVQINYVLNKRFGKNGENTLNDVYFKNFIQESDIEDMEDIGINLVRVPLAWSYFVNLTYNEPSQPVVPSLENPDPIAMNAYTYSYTMLTGDALNNRFKYLDWIVHECRKRGIYVVFDLHVVDGGQNNGGIRSRRGKYSFFKNESVTAQENAINVWKIVAERFNGNPGVAGYELLNEPGNGYRKELISFYDRAYKAIRNIDPDHIIMMEAGMTSATIHQVYAEDENGTPLVTLPTESERTNGIFDDTICPATNCKWTNVAYSVHDYFNSTNISDLRNEIKNKVEKDVQDMKKYNVPIYVGETNFTYTVNDQLDEEVTNSIWPYALTQYDNNLFSYTIWSYKVAKSAKFGMVYNLTWSHKNQSMALLLTDDYDTILNKWSMNNTEAQYDYISLYTNVLKNNFISKSNKPLIGSSSYNCSAGETKTSSIKIFSRDGSVTLNNVTTSNSNVAEVSFIDPVGVICTSSSCKTIKITCKSAGTVTLTATASNGVQSTSSITVSN